MTNVNNILICTLSDFFFLIHILLFLHLRLIDVVCVVAVVIESDSCLSIQKNTHSKLVHSSVMNQDNSVKTVAFSTSFIAEMMLTFMGLGGISSLTFNVCYFRMMRIFFNGLAPIIGTLATLITIRGIYVLWYSSDLRLKALIRILTFFVIFQLVSIIYVYVFISSTDITSEEAGFITVLYICCALSASALIVLYFHRKRKRSSTEVLRL